MVSSALPITGTTSACAENTRVSICAANDHRNYLRVRGEYAQAHRLGILAVELPPRARRIPAHLLSLYRIRGTTSACAENTTVEELNRKLAVELPPRARRIHENRHGAPES